MGELIRLEGIEKSFDDTVVLNGIDLSVDENEFVTLLGPSGCGKSTTLRMIAGLEDISSGEFCIDGKLMNDVEPKDRDIAMVFQNYALYPHMSVYDNMAFGLKLRKVPKDEIDKAVREAAKILDLSHLLDRKPKALSGGQRQRVAMGRAIVRNPQVFLMDEPLSNLDAKLRVQMRTEIARLHDRLGATIIYVTHDQTEAMTLGTRIVVMKDGIVQQVDTPTNLYNEPDNLFVAGFIGSPQMNFFDASLIKQDGKYAVKLGEHVVVLSEEKQAKLVANNVAEQEVTLGLRPEHLLLADAGVPAVVDLYEMMGASVHLHVSALERDVVLVVSTMDMSVAQMAALQMGSKIAFDFSGSVAHVFTKETGINLEA